MTWSSVSSSLHEVRAGRDVVHVHEHVGGIEVLHEMIVQAAHVAFAVLAAVVDKNLRHGVILLASPKRYREFYSMNHPV